MSTRPRAKLLLHAKITLETILDDLERADCSCDQEKFFVSHHLECPIRIMEDARGIAEGAYLSRLKDWRYSDQIEAAEWRISGADPRTWEGRRPELLHELRAGEYAYRCYPWGILDDHSIVLSAVKSVKSSKNKRRRNAR